MGADQVAGDGEAEAAAPGVVGPGEPVEDAVQLVGPEPGAGVDDPDLHARPATGRARCEGRDLDASIAFYEAIGHRAVGTVDLGDGARLVALADPVGPEVVLELVHRPGPGPIDPSGVDHLAIQVDDLRGTVTRLAAGGLDVGPVEAPGGGDGPRTAWLRDPDGVPIELVEWPAGHPVAMTEADLFPAPEEG